MPDAAAAKSWGADLASRQTAQIRPYFAAAILRGLNFSKLSYASFIDLQVCIRVA